ncbi:MAG: hypothetical protein ACRDHM_05345 [Actinomycetota bacterium]
MSSRLLSSTLLVALLTMDTWPSGAAAGSDFPRVVLHAPRGQQRIGALGTGRWGAPGECPPGVHLDFLEPPRRPVKVRTGKPMFIRFHKAEQPSTVELLGPRGRPIPFSLNPYDPDGTVVAWDAGFRAPRSGRRLYGIGTDARWPDENCPGFHQGAVWNFLVERRGERQT